MVGDESKDPPLKSWCHKQSRAGSILKELLDSDYQEVFACFQCPSSKCFKHYDMLNINISSFTKPAWAYGGHSSLN
ncbi:hypothetical protein HOLleu_28261 [Holothuria leucospilota]|uniref:Uncharacterized protein n=1 Tax=Holothuria leucospilota TaxID=206669 RepID=A0A9Q1BM09_HOLLE|nr:hypothetical protein HOLleu_28261 [Holothuria leucospilota]